MYFPTKYSIWHHPKIKLTEGGKCPNASRQTPAMSAPRPYHMPWSSLTPTKLGTHSASVGRVFCSGVWLVVFLRGHTTHIYIYGIYGNPLWKPFLNFNKVTMPYPAFLQTTNSHQLFFCTCDTMQWMMCRPSPALHLEHLHQTAPFVIEERPPMKPNQAPTPSGSNGGYPVEWFVGSFQGCWEVVQILDGKAKSFGCPQ